MSYAIGGYAQQQQQQLLQQQQQQQQQPIKTIIGTEEVKIIVRCLNDKPFNENYKLVTFDELNNQELLEVLNKVLSYLDKSAFENIKQKSPEQIGAEVVHFLNVLGYPVPAPPNDIPYQKGMLMGDKRIIYPILYFLLTRLEEHHQRAYLAKYLVPFTLPPEIPMEDDMKPLADKYRDLQAEFQVHHSDYQASQRESQVTNKQTNKQDCKNKNHDVPFLKKQNPGELKKEITSLEGEREQLLSKINVFKNKNTNRPEFQALLEVTNLLRKEQEEEARIADKIYQQRQQYEYTEQQLLSSQQRLLDSQKSMDPSNTPEQMLQSMRLEVKKNRELSTMRLAVEIGEKKKKLEQTEKLLSEPPITQNELSHLDNQLTVLRRAITMMEEKLSKQAPKDERLVIYTQQAQQIARKKEKATEELKRTEEEHTALEKKVSALQEKLNKEKGQGFGGIGDMNAYVKTVGEKAQKCKEMRKLLTNLEQEKVLLSRTEDTLKKTKLEYDKMLKKLERERGIEGFHDAAQQNEELQTTNTNMNQQKEKALEEYSQLTVRYNTLKKDKATFLKEQAEEQKEIQKNLESVEVVWKEKKANYDRVILKSEGEINQLEAEVKKLKDEVYRDDTKISVLKYSQQVLDLKLNRLNEEEKYQKGEGKLSNTYKSYVDRFQGDAKRLESQIQDLRKQREEVKENHEPSIRQQQMFSDLKKFLTLKLQVARGGNQSAGGRSAGGDYNILTIN